MTVKTHEIAEVHLRTLAFMSIQATEALYAARFRNEHEKEFPSIYYHCEGMTHDKATLEGLLELVFEECKQAKQIQKDIDINPVNFKHVAQMKQILKQQLLDKYGELFSN